MVKPSLVLLHGVGLDHTMWDQSAALLEEGFALQIPDLPGHGGQPPVTAGTTLAELADGVADQIAAGSHLVGFSLGALVAQWLAATRPELVATVTSVSSVCRRTRAERAAVLARLHHAEVDFAASAAASIDRWFTGTAVPQDVIDRTRATLLANSVPSFLACYRVFATGDEQMAPHLGQITARSLAITGAEDPGSTPEMTFRLATALPDCQAVVIPGARHLLPVQCPDEFVKVLTKFIGLAEFIGEGSNV